MNCAKCGKKMKMIGSVKDHNGLRMVFECEKCLHVKSAYDIKIKVGERIDI